MQVKCPYAALVEWDSLRTPAQPYLLPAALEAHYFALAAQRIKEELL